jgi:Tfp pilus assembly protein PilF
MALAIDLWIFRRPLKRVLMSIWPWLLLSIACALIARHVQPAIGIPRAPIWARPFVAGDTLAFYLYKLLLPVWLGIDYGRRPQVLLPHWWFYLTGLVPLALFGWLGWNRKARPALWVAGLVFAIGVAPVSGLVTFLFQYYSTTADHYLYLAMLGPAIAAAYVLSHSWRPVLVAIASIALILLAARTILQTQTWQDDEALNRNAMVVYPDTFLAHNNLGHYYASLNRMDDALPLFRRAVQLRPENWQAQENLGWALANKGQIDEAIEHIDKSIQYKSLMQLPETPKLADDYVRLGEVLMQRSRYADAADKFRQAFQLDPSHEPAKRNLAIALEKLEEQKSSATQPSGATTTPNRAPPATAPP